MPQFCSGVESEPENSVWQGIFFHFFSFLRSYQECSLPTPVKSSSSNHGNLSSRSHFALASAFAIRFSISSFYFSHPALFRFWCEKKNEYHHPPPPTLFASDSFVTGLFCLASKFFLKRFRDPNTVLVQSNFPSHSRLRSRAFFFALVLHEQLFFRDDSKLPKVLNLHLLEQSPVLTTRRTANAKTKITKATVFENLVLSKQNKKKERLKIWTHKIQMEIQHHKPVTQRSKKLQNVLWPPKPSQVCVRAPSHGSQQQNMCFSWMTLEACCSTCSAFHCFCGGTQNS
jgi:hypothetical protein